MFQMIHLVDGIYCLKSVYNEAVSISKQRTHLVRKLIPGVYRPETILGATLKGQSIRNKGRASLNVRQNCLDIPAREAIISKFLRL